MVPKSPSILKLTWSRKSYTYQIQNKRHTNANRNKKGSHRLTIHKESSKIGTLSHIEIHKTGPYTLGSII